MTYRTLIVSKLLSEDREVLLDAERSMPCRFYFPHEVIYLKLLGRRAYKGPSLPVLY